MTMLTEQLRSDLLTLPESDRAELFNLLGKSLEPSRSEEEEQAFEEVLARRLGEIESGQAVGISVEEMFARVNARLASITR